MMQPQGLGALMPQGAQQAPQMNNPRLNAAMDVVTSDAEEQILDPRTLAMLKYKDALQAMQAADQMMAAAQPQPMPPTVAERTKLAAEQGIAGLASRLSPGIQRQGSNMQAQQLQQAMSGGLPQLSAPNMARMAGGGIVAFDNGGGVEGGGVSRRDKLIALLIESGMEPQAAAEEADRTLDRGLPGPDLTAPIQALNSILAAPVRATGRAISGLTPEAFGGARTEDFGAQTSTPRLAAEQAPERPSIPSSTYGTGDRTGGQGRSLMEELGSARDVIGGVAGSVSDRVRDVYDSPRPTGEPTRDMMSQAEFEELADFISSYQPSRAEQVGIDAAKYAVENPIESAAMAAMAVPSTTVGLGALATRLLAQKAGPSILNRLLPLFTKPNPNVVRGQGFTMRPAGEGLRLFDPLRTGYSVGIPTLVGKEVYDSLTAEGGEQPATAEQVTPETSEDIVAQLPSVESNVTETTAAPATETYQDASPEAAALRAAALQTANLPSSAPGTTQSAQPSTATEGMRSVLEKIQGQTFDPEAAAEARSAELRRLAGVDDLVAQRREEQQRLRQMQEARFSPEESRRRRLRAGLGSLARRGLGGFSAGITEEEGRIFGEQEAVQRQALQDTNALIAELRAMGLTEFEVRNAARTAVQGQADAQLQQQVDIFESLQRGEESRLSNEQALNIALAQMNQEERQFIVETDARTQVALAEAMRDAIEANADTTEVARIYSSALANAPMDVDPVTYARKAVDDFIETYRPTITSGPLVPVNE